jgi:hypothetical protein
MRRHRSRLRDTTVAGDAATGLLEDQPGCQSPYGGPEPLIGGVRHLDEQSEGVIGISAQGVVERVEVELADLG